MNKQDQLEDERVQRDLRQKLNPQWQAQRAMHFQILGITEPVNRSARQIINDALKRQGYGPKKKRRGGVFGC